MKCNRRLKLLPALVMVVFILALFAGGVALAQGYTLTRGTVDGGGYIASTSSGGAYSLGGSIGQPDAGIMTGGNGTFTLGGGFWGRGMLSSAPATQRVYLPLVLKK